MIIQIVLPEPRRHLKHRWMLPEREGRCPIDEIDLWSSGAFFVRPVYGGNMDEILVEIQKAGAIEGTVCS